MATSYTKPHRDLADQVQLLISRGMNVTDVSAAQRWLGTLGYYRLSVYWYPYRVITQAPGGTTVRAESFQSSGQPRAPTPSPRYAGERAGERGFVPWKLNVES